MSKCNHIMQIIIVSFLLTFVSQAGAVSFQVQCPNETAQHPLVNASGVTGQPDSTLPNPSIKCHQISGGDGFATMADGNQIYLFAFGPLSGLADIVKGLPGTEPASVFNTVAPTDPTVGMPTPTTTYNGAIGLAPDPESNPPGQLDGHVDPRPIMDVGVMNGSMPSPTFAIDEDDEFFLTLTNVGMIMRPDLFEQHTVHYHGYPNASSFYDGVPDASVAINIGGSFTYYYLAPDAGTYMWHCHITPPEHLQMGMVGQVYVRPRQNRVPFGNDLYTALQAQEADPRTRCNTADDILCSNPLPAAGDTGVKHVNNKSGTPSLYVYNDGDGSTAYDVEYPLQIHGFDPSFHFVGMTFNPEPFTDMKDKYFLLNGRSYPDTINDAAIATQAADGTEHYSQPMRTHIYVIVIADDHAIIRAGLRVLLSSNCDHLMVGESADGYEAIRMVTQLSPQLLLIDLSMPRMGGTEAIRIIHKQYPSLKIITLTMHHNEESVRAAFAAGCNGYVLKDDTHQELLASIETVMEGHNFLSQSLCNQVVKDHLNPQSYMCKHISWGSLTQRELEIIKLIAEGNTNKMIARMLFISVKTVEKHRSNMMKKLGLHSASRITAYAIENSLV